MRSRDPETREAAADDLEALARGGLSLEEGLLALEAAVTRFPPRRFAIQDTAVDLVRAASLAPRVEYVPVVVRLFRKLGARARTAALDLLARVDAEEAAVALMALVRAHARPGRLKGLPTALMIEQPRFPEVYFPELFEYLEVPQLTWPICELCLGWLQRSVISATDVARQSARVLQVYADRRDRTLALGARDPHGEEYAALRRETALLLDLLGNIPTPAVQAELKRALDFDDVRLAYFAMTSLLRLGRAVDPERVRRVASNPEMRNWLWEELERQGRLDLFPADYRTIEAFAESELVRWLSYPAELGAVPDEIEMMAVVPVSPGIDDAVLDYYVFRFRLGEPHWAARLGWLAGVAGPYVRGCTPGTPPVGEAFSRFEPWSQRTPEGHVGDLEALARDWRDRYTANRR